MSVAVIKVYSCSVSYISFCTAQLLKKNLPVISSNNFLESKNGPVNPMEKMMIQTKTFEEIRGHMKIGVQSMYKWQSLPKKYVDGLV